MTCSRESVIIGPPLPLLVGCRARDPGEEVSVPTPKEARQVSPLRMCLERCWRRLYERGSPFRSGQAARSWERVRSRPPQDSGNSAKSTGSGSRARPHQSKRRLARAAGRWTAGVADRRQPLVHFRSRPPVTTLSWPAVDRGRAARASVDRAIPLPTNDVPLNSVVCASQGSSPTSDHPVASPGGRRGQRTAPPLPPLMQIARLPPAKGTKPCRNPITCCRAESSREQRRGGADQVGVLVASSPLAREGSTGAVHPRLAIDYTRLIPLVTENGTAIL